MALYKLRVLNSGDIAAGGYKEIQWSPSEPVKIKYIMFNERNGTSLNNVRVYIKFGGDVITEDYAPATVFGADSRNLIEVDRQVDTGTLIYVKIENGTSSTINMDIVFVLEM